LLGFTYDGFPIYGAYAYKNVNGTGGIVRMKSSYVLRNITKRNTYSDGSSVKSGPDVSTTYYLGYFREDYKYDTTTTATPDYLDEHNGRFCVTPEYPKGTYCYFTTVDSNWNSAYPYVVGPTFYGVYANAKVTSVPTTDITQYTGSSLPINLLYFSGSVTNNSTILKWATSNEINSSSFDIEKSIDGKTFTKIGSIASTGTTTSTSPYTYTDANYYNSTVYYRLKEWDVNGNFQYSNIISVGNNNEAFNLKVFPNPTSDILIVQANDLVKSDIHIILCNMKGQALLSRTIAQGSTLSIIETATFYAGEYVLTAYENTGFSKSIKVTLAK
jgi:hypothetical protein